MATQSLGRELGNRQFFIQRWEHEYPAFVNVFRALPPALLDYRPHPQSRSAGELVASDGFRPTELYRALCEPEEPVQRVALAGVGRPGTLAEMIDVYERGHDTLGSQLRSLDDDGWNHPAWLIQGTQEILLKDTVGGLLWIALFDVIHHRGQLSSYIRPMGGRVPSIYGPSGDEPG